MARRFSEQTRIADFERLPEAQRRAAVLAERRIDMNRAAARSRKAATDLSKTHRKTDAYVHLTYEERMTFLKAVADAIGSWSECTLFADAQMKSASRPNTKSEEIFDFAFEQVVTRFNTFLDKTEGKQFGLVVQDRNETAASRLTYLLRRFNQRGSNWSHQVARLVETPLFVDSELTSMVQLADVCSYATRRFFEKNETDLFDRIYPSFHRSYGKVVGLRHYTSRSSCACRVCQDHGRQ